MSFLTNRFIESTGSHSKTEYMVDVCNIQEAHRDGLPAQNIHRLICLDVHIFESGWDRSVIWTPGRPAVDLLSISNDWAVHYGKYGEKDIYGQ